jgi:hypothetical protein
MKKLFTWYNLLQEKEMLDFTEETENTDQEETPSQTEKETDGESNA